MTISLDFFPDPARARALDARMQGELGHSLAHVCDAARGVVAFDDPAMTALCAGLDHGRAVAPGMFGRYYELVPALVEGRADDAVRLFAELAAATWTKPVGTEVAGIEVVVLGEAALGSENERYLRMLNADIGLDVGFVPSTPEVAAAFRTRLADGLALLDRAVPKLAGEVRGIVRQIVIAESDPGKPYQFDGGSHYQLWGALFLNGRFHPDAVAVAEVLAHESAHSLLFGLCTDVALVENEDDELYASPLRVDPRPMDGIYHATFVSARMHWAMTQLAGSDALSADERARARHAAEEDLRNFDAGHAIVAEHGRLTAVGGPVMAGAKAYRDSIR